MADFQTDQVFTTRENLKEWVDNVARNLGENCLLIHYKRGWFVLLIPKIGPMEKKRYAVVTGGNKGIGFEISSQLALAGIEVILTARDESRGIEAVKKLNDSGLPNIVFHQLDINDPRSIESLVKFIETNFKKLDILINNAALIGMIMHEKFKAGAGLVQVLDENVHLLHEVIEEPYELGEECLKTNYFATKRVTEALIPLLQLSNSPRIVNLSSMYGGLSYLHNDNLKEELLDMQNVTEERIEEIIQTFLRDFKASTLKENGWPLTVSAYKVSKIALNAYTRILAKKLPNFLINSVHPGYVETDMTSQTGFLTVEEGARPPVMVALLPNDGPSGVFFHEMQISSFSGLDPKENVRISS